MPGITTNECSADHFSVLAEGQVSAISDQYLKKKVLNLKWFEKLTCCTFKFMDLTHNFSKRMHCIFLGNLV